MYVHLVCVCVCMGGCRCAAYGNLSLQHWPVETRCRTCEPGQQGPQCCFAIHKIRNCDPSKYPGGAPGHCTEVPSLAPEFCPEAVLAATNSSHSLHNYSTGWWWWDDETGWWGDHYIHSSPSPIDVGDRRSAPGGEYPLLSLASVVDGMLKRLVAEGDEE